MLTEVWLNVDLIFDLIVDLIVDLICDVMFIPCGHKSINSLPPSPGRVSCGLVLGLHGIQGRQSKRSCWSNHPTLSLEASSALVLAKVSTATNCRRLGRVKVRPALPRTGKSFRFARRHARAHVTQVVLEQTLSGRLSLSLVAWYRFCAHSCSL